MHTGKPGSWSTWAYHSRRWSSHIWHTSEGTVRGVCLPISNSAMLRKTSHETSITFITTPNESRYPCISHMDHLTNMKNIQIIDEWVLSLADHMVVQYKKNPPCLLLGQKVRVRKRILNKIPLLRKRLLCSLPRTVLECCFLLPELSNLLVHWNPHTKNRFSVSTHLLIIWVKMQLI